MVVAAAAEGAGVADPSCSTHRRQPGRWWRIAWSLGGRKIRSRTDRPGSSRQSEAAVVEVGAAEGAAAEAGGSSCSSLGSL